MGRGEVFMGVDIIIPIYNAYEDLQVCLKVLHC